MSPEISWVSRLRLRRGLIVAGLFALVSVGLPSVAFAGPGDVGVEGLSHTGTGTPTGTKRHESVPWFNDGLWWASLWDVATQDFYIHSLDTVTQTWVKTPTLVETRANTHADALWTGTKLYVSSHQFVADGDPAVSGSPSYLYRFSYDAAMKQYSLDAGFPTLINNYKTETLVIDRDSTGTLWATWQQGARIYINRTTGSNDVWGTPFELPSALPVTVDDNSSLIAVANKIFILFSDEDPATDGMYYSTHVDGAAPDGWSARQAAISGPGTADDHMNLKKIDSGGGRVFAATKTSFTQGSQPLNLLFDFDVAAGTSSQYTIANVSDCPNRPVVLVDEMNQMLHVYLTFPRAPEFTCTSTGGAIYEKTSPLNGISFAPGRGTERIVDADSLVHNVTTTKQNVNFQTGITIIADNNATKRYWHSYQQLPNGMPASPVASFTSSPSSGFAPLNVSFTDTSSGPPTAWNWSFGDGGTATTQNPTHTYTAAGTYQVTLMASNSTGMSTATGTITVQAAAPGIVRETVSTVTNSTATSSVAIPKPAGTNAGDVLVSCIATNGNNVSAGGVPAGWSTLASVTGASNPRLFGYYKIATASEPANYSWGLTSSVANSGGIARYSGSSGLDTAATQATGNSNLITVPGVTTTVPDAMLVGCVSANSSTSTVTIAPPSGFTAAWDLAGKRQQLADARQAVAGPSGSTMWTLNSARAWAGLLAALRPS